MAQRVVYTADGPVVISAERDSVIEAIERLISADPDLSVKGSEPRAFVHRAIGRINPATGRVTRLDDTEQTDADHKGPLFTGRGLRVAGDEP